MATYAIGDVQGCLPSLQSLLTKINFLPGKDHLWFTGDLVNRGPDSLGTLRFIKNLGSSHKIILGNHDLHLLALASGAHPGQADDTLQPILEAPDKDILLDWLRYQSLVHHDPQLDFTMVHAGFAPSWNLDKILSLAKEVEVILKSDQRHELFKNMYGNSPNQWSDDLTGWERIRCILNYLTRARFCLENGSLELKTTENMGNVPEHLIPWFKLPNRANKNLNIVFGHWAALGGVTHTPKVFALDTGCVWGYALTAMCLDNGKIFKVDCNGN